MARFSGAVPVTDGEPGPQGLPGPRGLKGDTGAAGTDGTDASFTIGTVTTNVATRANLIPNPDFETNLDGWLFAGYGDITRVTSEHWSGTASARVERYASEPRIFYGYSGVPVTAGLPYTASAYVKQQATNWDYVSLSIQWLDVSDSVISMDSENWFSANTASWTRGSITATAPAGATAARVGVFNGQTYYLDAVLFEQSATLNDYLITSPLLEVENVGTESNAVLNFTFNFVE